MDSQHALWRMFLHPTQPACSPQLFVLREPAGLTAVAEVDTPAAADFLSAAEPGRRLQRLLALERVQDPGNLVRREALSPCRRPCLTLARDMSFRIVLVAGWPIPGSKTDMSAQGTLTRSAAALGWEGIFLLPGAPAPGFLIPLADLFKTRDLERACMYR